MSHDVLDRLRTLLGAAAVSRDPDGIPRAVPDSTDAVAATLRLAEASGWRVRLEGHGSWVPADAPADAPDGLATYRAKRTAGSTPEPMASATPAAAPTLGRGPRMFVVHQHDATRMHWDLRLEIDGVLSPVRGHGDAGRLALGELEDVTGKLEVQRLLAGRVVQGVEAGLADEEARHGAGPEIVKPEETDPVVLPHPAADHLRPVLDFGQDRTVEVKIEVEATPAEGAVGGCGHRQVHQPAHLDAG